MALHSKHPISVSMSMLGAGALMLAISPFAFYAWTAGIEGFRADGQTSSRFFNIQTPMSNLAIFGHMIPGAILSVIAPLQLLGIIRTRLPRIHRILGYAIYACALLTGVGGLIYIVLQGTIGGAWMNAGFSLFGCLLIVASTQTVRHARARKFAQHRRWALRLFVLAIGSWVYRVHYGIWALAGFAPKGEVTFDTTFDLVQNFAFYLPYLVMLELWFRFEMVRDQRAISTQTNR